MTRNEEMDLRDYLQVLRRRRRPLVLGLLAVLALTVLLVVLMPRTYRSTAVLRVDQPAVPEEWVAGTAARPFAERLHALNLRVKTPDNLREIASKYRLLPDDWEQNPEWFSKMRDAISVQPVDVEVPDPRTARVTLATVALNVSFDHPVPETAHHVAHELALLYVKSNNEIRRAQAAATVAFLNDEATRLGKRLTELEQELSEFKRDNLESLPELVGANRGSYDRTLQELAMARESISSLEQRRVSLATRLAGTPQAADVYNDDGRRVSTADERLRLLRAQYNRALALYTEQHPDVQFYKQEIAALEAARGQPGSDPFAPSNPAYVALQSELASVEADLRTQHARLTELQKTAGNYERRLLAAPSVEKEYQPLIRERDRINVRYREISDRLLDAQMAAQLEGDHAGDRLYLLEAATLPTEPQNPKPLALMMLGSVLAIGGGIGAAAASEFADRSVRGRQGVRSVLSAAPLIVIPPVVNRDDRIRQRRRLYWRVGGALALAVALVLGLMHLRSGEVSATAPAGSAGDSPSINDGASTSAG